MRRTLDEAGTRLEGRGEGKTRRWQAPAIQAFEKALELEPGFEAARKSLEKLGRR